MTKYQNWRLDLWRFWNGHRTYYLKYRLPAPPDLPVIWRNDRSFMHLLGW